MEFANLNKAALFIDYENANNTDSYNPLILKLISLGYNPFIRKIISSTIPEKENIEKIIKENELEFILSYKSIKKGNSAIIKKKNLNNADFRVYIEVLKVLYTRKDINTFIIYTSDDDYHDLIVTLKKEGKEVIGVGSRLTTSLSYISLFHSFIYFEDLVHTEEVKVKKPKLKSKTEKKEKLNKEIVVNKTEKTINPIKDGHEKNNVDKNDIFYSILKDSTNEILFEKVKKGKKGEFLIANIVSELKEKFPYLKDFKKITIEDFRVCGFNIETQNGKRVKSYIDLDKISV